jgi:hypothetical protein
MSDSFPDDIPPELMETEVVYVGSPGSYGVAIVVAALAMFFLVLMIV